MNALFNNPVSVIDPSTRTIIVHPGHKFFGVESDNEVNTILFQCPKIVSEDFDLSRAHVYINYMNAKGELDSHLIENVVAEDDQVYFAWKLSRKVMKYKGPVRYIVCAKQTVDEKTVREWNTKIASGTVAEGIEANGVIVEENADVIEQILASIKTSLITLDSATQKASMTRSEILAMEAKGYRTAIKFSVDGPMAERMGGSLDTDTSVAFVCSFRPSYANVIGSYVEMNTVYLIDNDGNYTTYDYQLGNNRHWVTKDGMFYPEQNGFKNNSESFFFDTETFKDIPYLTHKGKLYQYIGLSRPNTTISPCITFHKISDGFNGSIIRDGMISDGTIPDIIWMSDGEYDSKNKCYPVHEAFSHSDELILTTTVDRYDFYATPPVNLTFSTITGPLQYRDVQDALTNRKRIRLLIYIGNDKPDASIKYSSKAPIELVGVCSRDFSASYYPDAYSITFFGVVNGDDTNPTFASLYLHMSRIQYNPDEVGAVVYRSNNNESTVWPYYQIKFMQFSEVGETLLVPPTAKANQIIAVDTVSPDGVVTRTKAVDMPSGGGGAKEWKLLQDVMVTADVDKQTSGVTYIVGDNGVHAIIFDKDANGAAFAVGELHIFGILTGSANSSLVVLSSDPTENVAVASYRNALGTAYAVYQIRISQVGGKWVTDQADKCTQYVNQVTPLAPTAMSNNGAFAGDMSKLLMIPDAVTLSKISIMTSAAQLGMSGRLLIYGR